MSICIGKTGKGKACNKKSQAGKKYCKIHDQNYREAKKAESIEKKAKSFKTLDHIANKLGKKTLLEGEEEDNLVKSIKSHKEEVVMGFVQKKMIARIKDLAVIEYDCYGYPKQETPFPRKFWMMLSWHLSTDIKTYFNMSMACKGLYKVFVLDKVRWYIHPLKNRITTPLLFFRPVYRVLSLQVPEELDDLLEVMKLPRIEDFLKVYEEQYGPTKSEFILTRRKADAIDELLKHFVNTTLDPDQDAEEIFEGAGLYTEYDENAKLEFEKFPYRYKIFKQEGSTFVIVDADYTPELERKIMDSILPYDGKFLIKLMAIN